MDRRKEREGRREREGGRGRRERQERGRSIQITNLHVLISTKKDQ